ncbi:hypothetical protein FB451DRAFT_952552, partial [Mycena latifolia]
LQTFGRLHPADLLVLMRTSRFLRQYLRDRSCKHVWTASLRSVDGLPKCPKGFDQPLYAALLFDTGCQV